MLLSKVSESTFALLHAQLFHQDTEECVDDVYFAYLYVGIYHY